MVRGSFVIACEEELKANEFKGNWNDWKPDTKEFVLELGWHFAKFTKAILCADTKKIREYACDIALYCDKAHYLAHTFEKQVDGKGRKKSKPALEECRDFS